MDAFLEENGSRALLFFYQEGEAPSAEGIWFSASSDVTLMNLGYLVFLCSVEERVYLTDKSAVALFIEQRVFLIEQGS